MHRCAKPHPAPVTVAKAAFDSVLRRSDGHDLRRETTFASTCRSDTTSPRRRIYSVSCVLCGYRVLK